MGQFELLEEPIFLTVWDIKHLKVYRFKEPTEEHVILTH